MWDFDGDEFFFFVVAIIVAAIQATRWYAPLGFHRGSFRWDAGRIWLGLAPLLPLVVILIILNTLADPQFVVGHLDYILLFLVGGAAWVFVGTRVLAWLGFEQPDLLLEHRNAASLLALLGGMLGIGLAYAGSNIGGGPTIWTTILPAFTATAALLVLGAFLELLTDTADAITIDRDAAMGLRTGALFVANGAILGRAMAGDWSNWPETFSMFARLGWPAIVLTLIVAMLNRWMRPTPQRPTPAVYLLGFVPAVVLLVVAVGYVVMLGMPEIAPAPPQPGTTQVQR